MPGEFCQLVLDKEVVSDPSIQVLRSTFFYGAGSFRNHAQLASEHSASLVRKVCPSCPAYEACTPKASVQISQAGSTPIVITSVDISSTGLINC